MSPARVAYKGKGKAVAATAAGGPRTPGVSVQTPATGRKTKDVFAGKRGASSKYDDDITWGSDSDDFGGMSPPKTIQFALPPSKLLQTPGTFIVIVARAELLTGPSPRGEQAHRRQHSANGGRGLGGPVRVQPDGGQDEPGHPGRYVLMRNKCKEEKVMIRIYREIVIPRRYASRFLLSKRLPS